MPKDLRGLGMSSATTDFPKPSVKAPDWLTPCSAKEVLVRQHQRVDIPAHAITVHKPSCRKHQKRISAESSFVSHDDPIGQGTELSELTVALHACPSARKSAFLTSTLSVVSSINFIFPFTLYTSSDVCHECLSDFYVSFDCSLRKNSKTHSFFLDTCYFWHEEEGSKSMKMN